MWRKSTYRDDYGFGRYVPVAERRAKAAREMAKLAKKGHPVSPVVIDGLKIARTFWGKAWCDNLERYSDYSNRLPRGRMYVRNGSVVDLQVAPGEVTAVVSGSELYRVAVKITPVPKARWTALCRDCGGAVDSLVELLQGRFSKAVMERICRQGTGLFPAPAEIHLACSCPDSARMCKHVAAVLYGIGARLDERPDLLFRLRQVDEGDLIASAGSGLATDRRAPSTGRVLDDGDLSAIFGVELAGAVEPAEGPAQPEPRMARPKAPVKVPTPAPPPAPRSRAATLPPGIFVKGAAVWMMKGRYAGYAGRIAFASALTVRSPVDLIYALALTGPDGRRARTTVKHTTHGTSWTTVPPTPARPAFTEKQGQYLAFIQSCLKLRRCAPAEAEIQAYFRVTPPTVHQMILTLERKGLISREPGVARSIRVLVPADQVPALG